MITDAKIEAALDYLARTVEEAAEARAQKIELTEGRKVIKAELMNQCNETSEAAKERFAYSHPEYKNYLRGLGVAVKNDAVHTFRRESYNATIEAWRTQQANVRAAERVT